MKCVAAAAWSETVVIVLGEDTFFFFLFTFVCTLTPAKLWPELNCAPSRGLQAHLPTHFSMNWDFCGVRYTEGLFLQLFFLCN